MTEQFTELQPPPDLRGRPEDYLRELRDWALRYHLTLEPMVKDCIQLKADITALGALTQTITDPPTKAEVVLIQAKVNAIIAAAAA